MFILVTGATSLVGTDFIEKVCQKKENWSLRCFVRETSDISELRGKKMELFYGDLTDSNSIGRALKDIDLIIHIAGIMYIPYILDALRKNKVRSGIFINTTGVFSLFKSAAKNYLAYEDQMNKFFEETNFNFVILRPTMIYGNYKDHNLHKLLLYINSHKYFPLFGSGLSLIQPVYYKDVSNALITLVENKQCWGKAYNVSGKEPMTYKRFIEIIAEALGKKVTLLHLPLEPIAFGISILEKIIPSFPIKSEQILRTTEDRAFDYTDARKCFGYNPISFEEGIKLEIEELKRDGYLM